MELKKRNWTGKWIEPIQKPAFHTPELNFEEMVAAEKSRIPSEKELRCVKHLRRKTDLKNEEGELPVRVTAFASSHGVYDLYINGRKADERLLAPETTNYGKLLWYQKYDLTALVCESDIAVIDVLLGDGWWIGRLGLGGISCNYGDRLAFLMDLELEYADGSKRTAGTDEQFVSCDSFIRYSDLYIGEMQDGRAFDYISPEKDHAESRVFGEEFREDPETPVWTNCIVKEAPMNILAEQPIPGIRVIEEIPSNGFVPAPNGDLVADFGKVIAGTVRICVDAPADTEIILEHGEVLDKQGNYYNNIKGLYKDQKDCYVCRGGMQTFAPHFTYHGFRYVRISGISREQIRELTALSYSTPLEKIGYFETDNKLINHLQEAIENSTVSNMISVPTDCPQREKLGWTGDINVFTNTGAFLYDLRAFLYSWLKQLQLDQTGEGEVPVVVPNHPSQDKTQRGMSKGTNSSAAWSDCLIFMPLNLYRIYGEKKVLKDNFSAMERWLSYVEKKAAGYLWTGQFHFGDWLIPSLREEKDGVMKGVMATADIVGSCYYSLAVSAMVEICEILQEDAEESAGGKSSFYRERAAYYGKLQEKIREAIRNTYVAKDGSVGSAKLQGLYVVMLKCGAVQDPEWKKKIVNRLVSLIEDADNTLDCGFASIGFLLDVLYENGHKETAYKLLFSQKAPSWLYMIRNGATTIWENWRAIKEDGTVTDSSYNHYAYGCVGDFMYRHIGGIEALKPGFSRVRIAPDFDCGIKKCRCARKLPALRKKQDGISPEIIVCWERNDGSGKLHAEIPEGVTAQIVLPSGTREVKSGVFDYIF